MHPETLGRFGQESEAALELDAPVSIYPTELGVEG